MKSKYPPFYGYIRF